MDRLSNFVENFYATESRLSYCNFKHYERLVSFEILISPFENLVWLSIILISTILALILSTKTISLIPSSAQKSFIQKLHKIIPAFFENVLNLLRVYLNQIPNHSSLILCFFAYNIFILSNYYTNYLTMSIIEPISPTELKNINEALDNGYRLVYPTAIPNVSDRASAEIESDKMKLSNQNMKMFGLTEDQYKRLSFIPPSVSQKEIFGYLGNPKKKSAFILKTYEYTKQGILNNLKAKVPKYTCTLCKQVLSKDYVGGLVITPLAQKKLYLLKLFKSSGLTNHWLQRQYFVRVLRSSKSLKRPETVYITISNLHAFLSLISILYCVEILIAVGEISRKALLRYFTRSRVVIIRLTNKVK